LLTEGQKFVAVGLGPDLADDGPGPDVVAGVEGDCAVARVVVGATPDIGGVQRQSGLGATQRLDLGLLIHRQDEGIVGRVHVQRDDVDHLLGERGILADLDGPDSIWLESGRAQIWCTCQVVIPACFAIN